MSRLTKKTSKTGRNLRPGFSFLATILLVLSACNESSPPPTPPTASCKQSENSKSSYGLTAEDKLDFQKDILPILSSSKDDEVYKCTFCHAGYAKEENFAKKEKIDAMIDQVEGLKMPLNGDEMRKDQIDIIKKWRDQKFPVGVTPVEDDEIPALTIDWEQQDQTQKDESKKEEKKPTTSPVSGC